MSSHYDTELYYTDKVKEILHDSPEYIKKYIRSIHNRTQPRTQYEYLKDINTFMSYTKRTYKLKNITLEDLDRYEKDDFEEYFESLEHYRQAGKDITNSRVSIKRKMSALRSFFAYLFENDMIKSDKIRKIEMPRIHKKEIIRLENDERKDFIHAVKSGKELTKKQKDYHRLQYTRDAAIVYLLLSTGLRVSECAELDLTDIDMKKCCVKVVRKGGNEAIVYFSDEAAGYLKRYLTERKEVTDTECPALFLSSRKTRLCARSIEILIKKYATRSVPAKHITPHKLRATYATNLYDATGDIYLVAEVLGHKDITTTKEHYANLSEKRKETNRNKIKID